MVEEEKETRQEKYDLHCKRKDAAVVEIRKEELKIKQHVQLI